MANPTAFLGKDLRGRLQALASGRVYVFGRETLASGGCGAGVLVKDALDCKT